jgi:hypothetical protein
MRRVLHVPIRHTRADLGSLAGAVARRRTAAAEADWRRLARGLKVLPLDWPRVRIYQDGLPTDGPTLTLVRDLAGQGSANHRLLLELSERGARVEGTEDPALLVAELALAHRLAAGESVSPAEARALLDRRDAAIAARIAATLAADEVGLLFLGAAHDPAPHLPDDITLIDWREGARRAS